MWRSDRLSELELSELVCRLVAADSDSMGEGEWKTTDLLEAFYRELGLFPRKQFCGESPQGKRRENVLLEFGKLHNPGRTLLYVGHTDVVPSGDPSLWTVPPYEPSIDRGRLYGRGSADMKGSLACTMEAVRRLKKVGGMWKNRIIFLYDVDEERENLGARTYLAQKEAVDFILVGEPTGCTIGLGHRGVMAFTVCLHGESAHAACYEAGKNAVEAAAVMIGLVKELGQQLNQRQEFLGRPSVKVTMISGGSKVNMIPESCTLRIDRRLLPGETKESCFRELFCLVKETEKKTGCKGELHVTTYCPPCGIRADQKDVKRLAACIREPKFSVFEASCEAGLFSETLGAPGVIFGPGSLKRAHVTDEYVELAELYQAADVYEAFFRDFLEWE